MQAACSLTAGQLCEDMRRYTRQMLADISQTLANIDHHLSSISHHPFILMFRMHSTLLRLISTLIPLAIPLAIPLVSCDAPQKIPVNGTHICPFNASGQLLCE